MNTEHKPSRAQSTEHRHGEAGFTLVELSIVLVIIGLIIGGILAGQDMIRAAEIRSTVSQIDSFNTSANTFRDKYRYLPGDLASITATQYGFTARVGTDMRGDGDGRMEGDVAAAAPSYLGTETGLFWRDLNQAGLIAGGFATATDAASGALTPATARTYLPESQIKGNYIHVYYDGGYNYFYLTGISAVSAAGLLTTLDFLTPTNADNIDAKMDDGLPLTGIVRAYTTPLLIDVAAADAAAVCVSSAQTPNDYANLTEVSRNSPGCQLRIRMQ